MAYATLIQGDVATSDFDGDRGGHCRIVLRCAGDGHGGGKPLAKVLEEQADIYSFILYNMGVKYKK